MKEVFLEMAMNIVTRCRDILTGKSNPENLQRHQALYRMKAELRELVEAFETIAKKEDADEFQREVNTLNQNTNA